MGREKETNQIQPIPHNNPTNRLGTAARLPHFHSAWLKVTSNNFILRIVKYGYKLQFSSFPVQHSFTPRNFSSYSLPITKAKVTELLFDHALMVGSPSEDQFYHIFFLFLNVLLVNFVLPLTYLY